MCTGAEVAAVASMAKQAAGEKQLGGMAPAHVGGGLGGGVGGPGGLGGGVGGPMSGLGALGQAQQSGFGGVVKLNPPPSLESLGSPLASQQNETVNPAQTVNETVGLPNLQEMAQQNAPMTQFEDPANAAKGQGGFGGFFGNLDENLQSESKVIGMGLLNRLDPRLGAAGLLAGGLFGKNKVFGQR